MEAKMPPIVVVILIQVIYSGMFFLSKAAFDKGMNNLVFVFYRQAASTVFLIFPAIIFGRKRAPPLSFGTFFKIFLLSLFGITLGLDVYGIGLIYTSATLAASTTNTIPIITFIVAVLLKQETVNLRKLSGIAKISGILLCLVGAGTLALYKGPPLKSPFNFHTFLDGTREKSHGLDNSSKTWIKGCLLMLTSNTLWALWLVLQVRVLESYPSKLVFTTLQCFLSTIESFIIAIIFERNVSAWRLHFDIPLLSVLYCGFVVTGITFYLQSWCVEKKGPVYLAMSTPLSLIITTFVSWFAGVSISLGNIIGGVILVGGLYSVLWGKSKEHKDPRVVETIAKRSLGGGAMNGVQHDHQEI